MYVDAMHPDPLPSLADTLRDLWARLTGRKKATPPTPPAPPNPPPTDPGELSRLLVAACNKYRVAEGLPILLVDSRLTTPAQAWADAMAASGVMSHDGKEARAAAVFRYGFRLAEENAAYGQPTPEAVAAAWMNDPGHRANILNRAVTKAGGGMNHEYWCMIYAG